MLTLSRRGQAFLGVFCLLSLVDLITDAADWRVADTVLLVLLMPSLACFLLAARLRRDRMTTWVVIALFWSWLGDTVGGVTLLVKIVLFLVAQLSFIAAFWPDRRRSVLFHPWLLAGYLIGLGGLIALVAVRAGDYQPAVIGYGSALGLMAVLASGVNKTAAVGGMIFLISDLTLALSLFGSPRLAFWLDLVVMPTYLLAQFLLVWGVLRRQVDIRGDTAVTELEPAVAEQEER